MESEKGSGFRLRFSQWLNTGWEYREGRAGRAWFRQPPAKDDATVQLPHSWNQKDTFEVGVVYRRGAGSYRRLLKMPGNVHPGTRWIVCSEGFYGTGLVFIDGRPVHAFDSQFLGFEADVTGHVSQGSNHVLGVRLSNDCPRNVLPGIRMPDFVLHGGLAGRCRLAGRPPLGLQRKGTWVRTGRIQPGVARMDLISCVENRTESPQGVHVRWRLASSKGGDVSAYSSEEIVVEPGTVSVVEISGAELFRPELWQLSDPALYSVEVELLAGEVLDRISFRTGIRSVEFTRDGCFLNGERVALRGCNRHESIPGIGNAMTPGLHRHDAELLREFGCNFVRLSHYPQHPVFLDACDELGILIYAEIATWKSVRGGGWLKNARRQMRDLVRRDRHHPSVVLWGMGNEGRHRKAYLELRRICRELDDTRPTVYAENHLHRGRRRNTLGIPDVLGINYEITCLKEAERESRNGSVVVSECSLHPTPRADFSQQVAQVQKILKDLSVLGDRASLAGQAIWCFSDYATLRKQRYVRFPGIVDAWRIPKLSAFLLKALFDDRPCLLIAGDWSEAAGATARELHVLSNCGRVAISTAGKTVHMLEPDPYAVCSVEFSGEQVDAEGTWNDQAVTHSLEPWGPATALRAQCSAPADDLHEIAWLDIEAVDARGNNVLDYSSDAEVRVHGPAQVLCHRESGLIPIERGMGRAYVQGADQSGEITFMISCGRLSEAQVSVSFPVAASRR